jgi:DNA-binding response OmpR family regulator
MKPKILLCEDEEFVARSYIRKLQIEGYEVLHASNGEEALRLLRSDSPDLIVLDLMMPIKTGFDVLKEMRADENLAKKNVPVIVASNLGQKSDMETARSLGAVDFLIKSNISLKEFAAKIREYLPIT